MIPTRLKYCKTDNGKVPFEGKGHIPNDIIDEASDEEVLRMKDPAVPSDYQKSMPTIDVDRIFIISGGTTREKDYFEQFSISKRLSIIFISKKGEGLIPERMVNIANDSIKYGFFTDYFGENRDYLDGDKIYLVQDVDHYGRELKTFYTRDKSQPLYKWIISNPCLEIWLYYHFKDDISVFSDCISMQQKSRSKWLKKELNKKIDGGVNPKQLMDKTQTAIDNAKSHIEFSEDGFPELFTTEMYIVAESIVSSMNDELPKLIREKEEYARQQREKHMK